MTERLKSRKFWMQLLAAPMTFWLVKEGIVPPETWIGYLVSLGLYHVGQGIADRK